MSDTCLSNKHSSEQLASASRRDKAPVGVLFVCLGNICRSPTAQGVFESLLRSRKLDQYITVDSAGTGDWHIGHAPDPRAQQVAEQRGYSLEHLRSRQIVSGDFDKFDYILAMDHSNLNHLQTLRPANFKGVLDLFLNYAGEQTCLSEVPDPYTGGGVEFEQVFDLVESVALHLLAHICKQHIDR